MPGRISSCNFDQILNLTLQVNHGDEERPEQVLQSLWQVLISSYIDLNSSEFPQSKLEHSKHQMFKTVLFRLVMAVSGESGDTTQFAEYIAKNIALYKMRNGWDVFEDKKIKDKR